MERAVRYLVKRHRERDERGEGGALAGARAADRDDEAGAEEGEGVLKQNKRDKPGAVGG